MLKLFVCLSALFVSASCGCLDNGDKEIGGSCYKFVSQKLSFEDARDWCHYKNPVTPSYLAHVGNQFTANFLASYGQSIFGASESFFWIGLSRNRTWMPWTWDNGYQAGYTNFGNNALSQNYAAEAISNTKWSTFGDDTKMYFVCSYDPTAPPTFGPPVTAGPTAAPTTTAVPVTTPTVPTTTDCTPNSPFVILFAYSNDFAPEVVRDVINGLVSSYKKFTSINTSKFANIRFDTRQTEAILFHDDLRSWQNSILARLPDPEISFGNVGIGSDVLNVFRNLIFNKVTNACGARVITLLKRYSNELDVTDLILELQKHHIFIQTMGSFVSSGGLNRQAVYDVSKGSNGIYVYGEDNKMSTFVPSHLDSIFELNLIYAVNPYVTGKDSEGLPMLICPTRMPRQGSGQINSYMMINVQDDGHLDRFNSLTIWIVDNDGDTAFKQHVTRVDIENGITYSSHLMNLYEQPYNYTVMMAYDYSPEKVTNVEIRIYAYVQEPIWPPYDY